MIQIFILILALTGCNSMAGPYVEGYVVDINKNRFLVTAYDAKRGKLAANNATWFTGKPNKLKIGQKVKVWTNGVKESYPAQADADKCKVVEDGAEAEAIGKALQIRKTAGVTSVPFVVSIKKDAKNKTWDVQFAGGLDGKMDTKPITVNQQ